MKANLKSSPGIPFLGAVENVLSYGNRTLKFLAMRISMAILVAIISEKESL